MREFKDCWDIDEKSGRVTPIDGTLIYNSWQLAVIKQNEEDEMNKLEDLYPGESKFTTESYQAFIKVTLDNLQDLIKRKQADYVNGKGPFANFEQASDFGVDPFKGVMLRMGDKFQRIKSFCSQGELQVKNEGVEDSLSDLIGYSLIALAMLEEKKRNNNK